MSKAPTDAGTNPKLLIALGVVAVAALLFQFVARPLLFDGGDEAAVQLPLSPAEGRETPLPGQDGDDQNGEDEAGDDEAVSESLEVFHARDPFQQLVTAEGQVDPTAVEVDPGQPSASAAPDAALRLDGVFAAADGAPRARVAVDGVVLEVGEGEEFAERFQMVEINDQCATVAADDEQVALCTGEEVRA